MTENDAIEILKVLNESYFQPEKISNAFDVATDALKEIEQYRAIGTVEFLRGMKDNYVETLSALRQYQKLGTVEEIKDILSIISENQDDVDESGISTGLLHTLLNYAEYKKIGTVEECRKARENKWIQCSEHLPEEPEKIPEDDEELEQMYLEGKIKEYIVTIQDSSRATTLHYIGKNKWIDILTLERYEVIAWQQLPGPYQERKE